jgi:glycogen(starch) synthase
VLTLTWEFPPHVTGGLSMASYGIVRALLGLGVEVDLVVPTPDDVYFPLRTEEDADSLPVRPLEFKKGKEQAKEYVGREVISKITPFVGAYFSGEVSTTETIEQRVFVPVEDLDPLSFVLRFLAEEAPLFAEVKRFAARGAKMADSLDFDLIHTHDWLTYPAAMLVRRLSGKPLVAHIHSTEFDRAGGPGDDRIHNIEYMGTQLADRVIAVSSYTAKMVADRYRVDQGKIRVAHNAFTLESTGKEKKRMFREPTVVFVGRITLQKGPDYFLEVARRVLKQEKKVRFVMAGKGDMEKQILHRAASLGLGTRFLFAGFLTREELEPILSAADIFLMPSISEPFGIVALEAMSCGAVAIVAKQSGVAEAITNAYKVDFWDVERIVSIILELVRNPDKLREMSGKSIKEARKVQWIEAGTRILDVYRELVKA